MSEYAFFHQPDFNIVPDTAPVFDKAALERLLRSAESFSKDFGDADRFFDTVLETAAYLCLFPMRKRDRGISAVSRMMKGMDRNRFTSLSST